MPQAGLQGERWVRYRVLGTHAYSMAETRVHVCAKSLIPPTHSSAGARIPYTNLLPQGGKPHSCLYCSSSSSLCLLFTYLDSWSLLNPVRVSCHLSSSPKVSCNRKPSRWVAHGSPQCCPLEAQFLGKRSLSTALGRSHFWALPPHHPQTCPHVPEVLLTPRPAPTGLLISTQLLIATPIGAARFTED